MIEPPRPVDEAKRLVALRALGLLDTLPEERFDRITRLAQQVFGVPIALVSLVDDDRQWFKSRVGLDVTETPRTSSFCAHALTGDGVLRVADARSDLRFADNPLVVGDPNIRFYAGAPIAAPDGSMLGTLCIIDREARVFGDDEVLVLEHLAELVEREIATVNLAVVDDLTGLGNRRGFHLVGQKVLELCVRRLLPATAVFIDLDGLKRINDEHGHGVGDEAICEAAGIIQRVFRASDVVARIGGDEFAALLSGVTDPVDSLGRLAGELRECNASPDRTYPLAISVGTASFDPVAPIPLDQLLARADASMYEQKVPKRKSR